MVYSWDSPIASCGGGEELRSMNKKKQSKGRKPLQNRRSKDASQPLAQVSRMRSAPDPVHRFERTTATSALTLTETQGFNASGRDLTLTFALDSTTQWQAGVVLQTTSNPGASDLTALFDLYRIDEVEVTMMFASNVSQVDGDFALPTIFVAEDPDSHETTSQSQILQYGNVRTIQLGSNRNQAGYTFRIKPRPVRVSLNRDGTTNVNTADMSEPWFSCDDPGAEYNALKFVMYTTGLTGITNLGVVSFIVRYFISCKRTR
jgi:hypothetical protein